MAVVWVLFGFLLSYIESWPKTLLPCILSPLELHLELLFRFVRVGRGKNQQEVDYGDL